MGLFTKKKPSPVEHTVDTTQIDRVTQVAHDRLLKFSEDAITKAYKDRRLVFSKDAIFYTDQAGKTVTNTGPDCIDQFSQYMFNRLNSQLSGRSMFGVQPNMVMVGVTVNDIRDIILKLKGG